ncbi:rhodanese-like domain-containing protein [Runella sp. SP2]|uniref:rhodanese-like domain-containing protein n=1 Tax=Runella sp. SP2 TaxID=2268026 RepID=UPI000F084586|nr:rhodanese-like domain-containing protein [Runella sp. SP2]AYQ34432.1 rhodanese-like domain-containing protein [Runella sp. SP2]
MKTLLATFTFVIVLLAGTSLRAQENLAPKEFIQKLKTTPNAQLLDVRTPNEWNAGKIASSKCINYNDPAFKEQVQKLDKDKPVFVYCAVGGRSTKASQILKESGFKLIYNLQGGGYADLAKEGIK